jgi:hypothetical protein
MGDGHVHVPVTFDLKPVNTSRAQEAGEVQDHQNEINRNRPANEANGATAVTAAAGRS